MKWIPLVCLVVLGLGSCRQDPQKGISSAQDTATLAKKAAQSAEKDTNHTELINETTIEGTEWRVFDHVLLHDAKIQKKINGQWVSVKDISYVYRSKNPVIKDVNNDGYEDIVIEPEKEAAYAYFYDPKTKSFRESVELPSQIDKCVLIDKEQNIYCGFSYENIENTTSTLFTFKDFEPYYYHVIKFVSMEFRSEGTKEYHPVASTLYECDFDSGDTRILKLNLVKGNDCEGFDYVGFWKRNYKKLLKERALYIEEMNRNGK